MNRTLWIILGLMFIGHFVAALFLPSAMELGPENTPVWCLIGVVLAQVNLIALWLVFAPGKIGWRLPWAGLMVGGMWTALVIGNRFAYHDFDAAPAVQLLIVLTVAAGMAQVPLWFAKIFLKLQFFPPAGPPADDEAQYNLRQLLVSMGLLSVMLGIGRWVMPGGDWTRMQWEFTLLVILAAITIVNLLVVLPAMWIATFADTQRRLVGYLLLVPYLGIITFLEHSAIDAAAGRSGEHMLGMMLLNMSQVATVALTLGLLRWLGFRWLTQAQWEQEQLLAQAIPPIDDRAIASDVSQEGA